VLGFACGAQLRSPISGANSYPDAKEVSTMPMHLSYLPEELRLDLSFSGNLDVSLSHEICCICDSVPLGLRSCIIDLSGIDRLFDSGMALLKMVHGSLVKNDVLVVVLSDCPEVREHIPTVASCASHILSLKNPGPSRIARAAEAARQSF
jgi:hypothetical protein